jgi:hypothetical protein
MNSIMMNWKTSLPGIVLVLIGLLEGATGIHIPGFSMDAGAALAAGIGLLMSKDAS